MKHKQSKTAKILAQMLTENTGRSFLDSGGAYGRHWEQNQGVDFEARPSCTLKFSAKLQSIEISVDLYHWLLERLDFDEDLNEKWERYDAGTDAAWDVNMKSFIESIGGKLQHGWYTYNEECHLSQDFVAHLFEYEGTEYVFLQIHGGCDARGGFTAPKIFTTKDESGIYDFGRASIMADSNESPDQLKLPGLPDHLPLSRIWDTEDAGYSWRPEWHGGSNLETYTITEDETLKGDPDHIYVDPDGIGYCPKLGTPLVLHPS